MQLFALRGQLTRKQSVILALAGALFILLIWTLLTIGETPLVSSAILPHPARLFTAYPELYRDNELIRNTCLSFGLNLAGYIEAILLAVLFGFLIGLIPLFRGAFQRPIDAFRYVPLTAVTGIFIAAFGVGISMKAHFLAFGILIYMLPVVVQRIYEVDDVYLKTVYTLGATDWQTIKTVYFPAVISRLSDDVRVLTAISWTYIIVAESIGNEGGIGALIWRTGLRQGRADKVFALLIIIMIIGMLQDRIFMRLDRYFFPHKYQVRKSYQKKPMEITGIWRVILDYVTDTVVWIAFVLYVVLTINEFIPIIGQAQPLSYLFGDTVIAVHFVAILVILYRGRLLFERIFSPKKNIPAA